MTQYRIGDLPPMQELGRGGALRFGVLAADGRRSRVWSVIGSRNTRDVFAGARETFGEVKLSFHTTWWRLAHTEPYARKHLAPGEDRLIKKWRPAPELLPGWRHAFSIIVASSLLGPPEPVDEPKRGTISWYADPGANGMISFKLLLGEPERMPWLTGPHMGTVGTIKLPDGGLLQVTVEAGDAGPFFEPSLAARRAAMAAAPDAEPSYWAWADDDNPTPSMLDMSALATLSGPP